LAIALFMAPFLLAPVLLLNKQPALWRESQFRGGAVRSMALTASQYGRIDYIAFGQQGVLTHQDDGPWQPSNRGLPLSSLDRLAVQLVRVAPWDNRVAFAALRTNRGTVYRTRDGGNSWISVLVDVEGPVQDMALSSNGDHSLFVATASRIYRSLDQGDSWSRPVDVPTKGRTLTLALAPNDPNRIYLGQSGGQFFRTDDGGAHWTSLSAGLGRLSVRALALDPGDEQHAYVGTSGGVYGTRDGGLTWNLLGWETNVPPVRTLLVDPLTPNIIYAGTEGHGVYWSANRGRSWSLLAEGMGPVTIYSLALDPVTHDRLFAGSSVGLWTLDISAQRAAISTVSPSPQRTATQITPLATGVRTETPTSTAPPQTPAHAATREVSPTSTALPAATSTGVPVATPSAALPPTATALQAGQASPQSETTVSPSATATPVPPAAGDKPEKQKEEPPRR